MRVRAAPRQSPRPGPTFLLVRAWQIALADSPAARHGKNVHGAAVTTTARSLRRAAAAAAAA
eukprot:CAMPEP_0182587474 /NCGR_PEP_ID=MMETSP1324-20130603/65095_1 /TAXON_ID=236786 /ORGANISM="Florenciella sp., Strain RCC1587" /LENGTH=61 /DNA_ID=CAMNT_0024804469 /DNA_START=346 /DNA_END=528 /DNA_ORIENTATION=+